MKLPSLARVALGAVALTTSLIDARADDRGAVAPKPLFRDTVYDGAADPIVVWNPAQLDPGCRAVREGRLADVRPRPSHLYPAGAAGEVRLRSKIDL